jgi:RNA 2',3'-cyclic 3'-phosphodiesterase
MPRRHGRNRLYFAFRPDDAARDAAMKLQSELRRRLGATATAIKRENLDVSIFPLWEGEEMPPDLVEVAVGLVQAIEGTPFDFKFDTLMSLSQGSDGNCAVLASTHDPFELYSLQRKFVSRFEGMVRAGSLIPHMTLLYADTFVERQAVEPVRWQAREFLLIHSLVGQARQEILGRWPLR